MRTTTQINAALAVAAMLGGLMAADAAQAQSAAANAGVSKPATELSAQSRSGRPRVRIYRNDDPRGVYPKYFPGPNAVRECTANLVQEFRPSGTVIVPRMNCYWRRG